MLATPPLQLPVECPRVTRYRAARPAHLLEHVHQLADGVGLATRAALGEREGVADGVRAIPAAQRSHCGVGPMDAYPEEATALLQPPACDAQSGRQACMHHDVDVMRQAVSQRTASHLSKQP